MKNNFSKVCLMAAVLAMVMALTACGDSGKDKSTGSDGNSPKQEADSSAGGAADTDTSSKNDVSSEDKTASGMETCKAPELAWTIWEFTGGTINGTEMTQEEIIDFIEAHGSSYFFMFEDDLEYVLLCRGEKSDPGSYQVGEDGSTISIDTDFNEWSGSFVKIDGETAMALTEKSEPEKVFYFIQGGEK